MKKVLVSIMMGFLVIVGMQEVGAVNYIYLGDISIIRNVIVEDDISYLVDVDSIDYGWYDENLQFNVMSIDENSTEKLSIKYNEYKDKIAAKQRVVFNDVGLESEDYYKENELEWYSYPENSAIASALDLVKITQAADIIGGHWGLNPLFIMDEVLDIPAGAWDVIGAGKSAFEVNVGSIVVDNLDNKTYAWIKVDDDRAYCWCIDNKRDEAAIVASVVLGENVDAADIVNEDEVLWLPLNPEGYDFRSEAEIRVLGMMSMGREVGGYLNSLHV